MNSSQERFQGKPQEMRQIIIPGIRNALLFLSLSFAVTANAQNVKPAKVAVPSGAVKESPAPSLAALTQQSEVIAVGTVSAMEPEWNEDKSRIQTRVRVSVDETIKGTVSDNSLTVVIPGGEIDGVGELYTHSATFQKNEDVIVFASKDAKGNMRVTSGMQGKFLIQKDKATGVRKIANAGTLEEFKVNIKNSMKTQKQ